MPIEIPKQPWFTQLYHHWEITPERVCIRDYETGKNATFTEFLYDVVKHGEQLRSQLSEDIQTRLRDPSEEVFITILAAPGYEFAVIVLAIYSIGGIAVPLRPLIHVEEAKYFMELCNAVYLTTSTTLAPRAREIASALNTNLSIFTPSQKSAYENTKFILTPPNTYTEVTNTKATYNPERGFAMLFTSGTTGPPKGVLYSCGSFTLGTQNYQGTLSLRPSDTWIHQLPVHWKGGFDFFLAAVYAGSCIEFCSSVFSPEWFWGRMRTGGISCMLVPPMLLSALKESLDVIQARSSDEFESSLRGLNEMRFICTGSLRVPEEMKEVWSGLRGGRQLVNMYGFTEATGMIAMTDWSDGRGAGKDSCGGCVSGTEVKVDSEGEVCVRGPLLMKRYISTQPDVTKKAFDSEGFYKTGDTGSIGSDRTLKISGRASQDIIRFLCRKINAADIEDPLRQHPAISQAFILGIDDHHCGQRVAALLITKPNTEGTLKIQDLRRWLGIDKQLPAFKLPTLLRAVSQDKFVGMTDSGKPSKKKMRALYFSPEVIKEGGVEVWDYTLQEEGVGDRPFDWEGCSVK
ncbi:hypothetical protein BJX99DRAFT_108438 [Aspergillus californicus]